MDYATSDLIDKIDILCLMMAIGISVGFYGLAGLIAPPRHV